METVQLLNAIVEVSQSVARLPCPPEQKEEVLEKVKTLFSCYNDVAVSLASFSHGKQEAAAASAENAQTRLKAVSGKAEETGNDLRSLEERVKAMDSKLSSVDRKLNSFSDLNRQDSGDSMSSLKSEFTSLSGTLVQLKHFQDSLCNRVCKIENKSNDFELLQGQVEQIRTAIGQVDVGIMIAGFQGQLGDIDDKIAQLNAQIDTNVGPGSVDSRVAFVAATETSNYKYTPQDVIRFTNIHCNYQDCFIPSSGKFKSKCYGLYFFVTSINTNSVGDFTAAIVHNSESVALFGTPGNRDLQTGASAVLKLWPGDEVFIQVDSQSDSCNGVEIGGGFSNFAGFQIA